MNDGAPPFEPPHETLNEAVSQQLDYAARLDALERQNRLVLERQSDTNSKLSGLRADLDRCLNATSTNGMTLERIEGKFDALLVALKKAPRG